MLDAKALKAAKAVFNKTYVTKDGPLTAAITAYIQAVGPEPAVAVKPLAWNERGFAHTSAGIMYRVTHQPGYWRLEKIEGYSTLNSAHPTEDAAKATAEADYASRIRSALVATPPAERVVEVAAQYAERLANVLWEKHYRNAAPNWKPLTGDLIGIITQIDNMTSGLALATKPAIKDDETVVALPPTREYVDRIVRIFRDRPADDTSAVVLQDYARAALAAKEGRS